MSVIGTDLKINVNVKPIGDISLSQCDFTCTFFISSSKSVILSKSQLVKIDNDNYLALFNSEELGVGTIKMTIEIKVPDPLFDKGYRTEIETVCTGINITK